MQVFAKWKAYLHRRRFYYRILFSFAALCICTVALTAAFSFRFLGNRYEEKILEANRNMLSQVAMYTDQSLYLSMMHIINDRILNDYTQNGFSRFYLNGGTMTPYEYYRCHQQAIDLRFKNELIRSITLYRRQNNYLIDSDYGVKSLPDDYVKELDAIFPFSKYLELAHASQGSIAFCRPAALQNTKRANLTIIRAVPLYSELRDADGLFIIAFDQEALLRNIAALYPYEGAFLLLDTSGEELLSTSGDIADFDKLKAQVQQALRANDPQKTLLHNGVEYTMLGITGDESNWHYISLIPSATLVADSTDAKRVLLLVSLLLLCLALVTVHVISARVYRPLSRLRTRATANRLAEGDDISAIGDVLGFLEDKVDDMEKTVEQNRDVLVYKAMMEALHERHVNEADLRKRFELGGVRFLLPCFCLMVTEFKESVFDSLSMPQQEYLIQRAKSFMAQWLNEPVIQMSETQDTNRIVTLINLREGNYEEIVSRRLELLSAVQPDLHVGVNVALSSPVTAMSDIARAYARVSASFVYTALYGYGNVYLESEVEQWKHHDFTVDLADYQRYEGMLRAGQAEDAYLTLEGWEKRALSGGYSYDSVGAFLTQLFSLTFKFGREQHLFDDPVLKESVIQEFNAAKSFTESIGCICSIIRMYQSVLLKKREGSDARLAADIMDYVRANCRQELSLTSLAERFHVGSSHLSRLFKGATGYNLSLFIVNCRLEEAAKWLVESPETGVAEIAEALGYLTPAYFTRLFKEKYGMTPSQYRKHYMQQEI